MRRIRDAYLRAKTQQARVPQQYSVGPMWERIIQRNFGELAAALEGDDVSRVQRILCNFHREPCALSAGGSREDLVQYRDSSSYRFEYVVTWMDYYKQVEAVSDGQPGLSYPQVGNPVGLSWGDEIIPLEALRYHYYAIEIASLLSDVEKPVVCEIGGGLGGQTFKLLEKFGQQATAILFDIPEILVISSFFLMSALPDRSFQLYGEGDPDPGRFDVVLMPQFMLPSLTDQSVDLFFNSCSFSEIRRDTAEEYLRQIGRACRRYLLHINHTVRFSWELEDGSAERNLPADEMVPDSKEFKRIYKHPRVFGRPADIQWLKSRNAQHFAFLYERLGSSPPFFGRRTTA